VPAEDDAAPAGHALDEDRAGGVDGVAHRASWRILQLAAGGFEGREGAGAVVDDETDAKVARHAKGPFQSGTRLWRTIRNEKLSEPETREELNPRVGTLQLLCESGEVVGLTLDISEQDLVVFKEPPRTDVSGDGVRFDESHLGSDAVPESKVH